MERVRNFAWLIIVIADAGLLALGRDGDAAARPPSWTGICTDFACGLPKLQR